MWSLNVDRNSVELATRNGEKPVFQRSALMIIAVVLALALSGQAWAGKAYCPGDR